MTTNDEMEGLYGPLATHSDYKIGESIGYYREGRDAHQGIILWVCGPYPVLMRDGRTTQAPLSYIVDGGLGMPDICYSNDIIPPHA